MINQPTEGTRGLGMINQSENHGLRIHCCGVI